MDKLNKRERKIMNMIEKFIAQVEETVEHFIDKKMLPSNPVSNLNEYVKQADQEIKKVAGYITRQGELLQTVRIQSSEVSAKLAERKAQLQLAELANDEQLIVYAKKEVAALEERVHLLVETEEQISSQYVTLEQQFEQMKHQLETMKIRQLQFISKENAEAAFARMKDAGSEHLPKNAFNAHVVEENETKAQEQLSIEERLVALQQK